MAIERFPIGSSMPRVTVRSFNSVQAVAPAASICTLATFEYVLLSYLSITEQYKLPKLSLRMLIPCPSRAETDVLAPQTFVDLLYIIAVALFPLLISKLTMQRLLASLLARQICRRLLIGTELTLSTQVLPLKL